MRWRRNDGQMRWTRALLGALVAAASGLVMAQDADVVYRGAGHVEELQRYLDRVEIYAPIEYRRLAVFPARLRGGQQLGGRWLTLDEALAQDDLVVTEKGSGGQVPLVTVENRSRQSHVFLMSGELLSGGKQARTIRRDAVLAPRQRIELPVFCVEAHRWRGESRFSEARSLLPQSIHKSLRKGADQTRIWSEVAGNNAALGAENETGSLEMAMNSAAVRSKLHEVRAKIVPDVPADSTGFIFVALGHAVGADFFGRPSLALKLLPKLLDAYSVDFIVKRTDASPARRSDRREAAIEFFERIRRAGSQRVATPGSGAGIRTRAGGLVGDGVSLGGAVVHYGVQVERRIVPLPVRRAVPELQR